MAQLNPTTGFSMPGGSSTINGLTASLEAIRNSNLNETEKGLCYDSIIQELLDEREKQRQDFRSSVEWLKANDPEGLEDIGPLIEQGNALYDEDEGDADSSGTSQTSEDQEEATRAATPEQDTLNGEIGEARVKQHVRPESQRMLQMATAAPNQDRRELKQHATSQATEQEYSLSQQTDGNNVTAAKLDFAMRMRDAMSRLRQALAVLEELAEEGAKIYGGSAKQRYLEVLRKLMNEPQRRCPLEVNFSETEEAIPALIYGGSAKQRYLECMRILLNEPERKWPLEVNIIETEEAVRVLP